MFLLMFSFMMGTPVVWEISNEDLSSYIPGFYQVVVTETEDVYILDRKEKRIFHLDAEGKERHVFGRDGDGPGEMRRPFSLQYHPGLQALILGDGSRHHLQAFSLDGEPQDLEIPRKRWGIVLDKEHKVFVKRPNYHAKPDQGASVRIVNHVTNHEKVLLKNDAKRHQDPVKVTSQGGTVFMQFNWQARTLVAISFQRKWIVMGSNIDLDLQVYDLGAGSQTGRISADDVPRHPLIEEEIQAHGGSMFISGKSYKAQDFPHPDFKPEIKHIFFDKADRLWVEITRAWEAKMRTYRVFDLSGKEVGSIVLDESLEIKHADKDHLWVSRYDEEEDYSYLQKRRYQLDPAK